MASTICAISLSQVDVVVVGSVFWTFLDNSIASVCRAELSWLTVFVPLPASRRLTGKLLARSHHSRLEREVSEKVKRRKQM